MLSKLDERYFEGLTGKYFFELAFRLHKSGQIVHIIRGCSSGERSASTEVDLDAGQYDVFLHISATRYSRQPRVEDVIKQKWLSRRSKFIQIGLSYDLAHAKGQIEASEDDQKDAKTNNATRRAEGLVNGVNPSTVKRVPDVSIKDGLVSGATPNEDVAKDSEMRALQEKRNRTVTRIERKMQTRAKILQELLIWMLVQTLGTLLVLLICESSATILRPRSRWSDQEPRPRTRLKRRSWTSTIPRKMLRRLSAARVRKVAQSNASL